MKTRLLLILTILYISTELLAQGIAEKNINKLNEYAIPFIKEDLNSDTRFQQFNSTLNNKKIIALANQAMEQENSIPPKTN